MWRGKRSLERQQRANINKRARGETLTCDGSISTSTTTRQQQSKQVRNAGVWLSQCKVYQTATRKRRDKLAD